jgi:hypothetical protein
LAVFAMDANAQVSRSHPKAMAVILMTEEVVERC